MVWSEYFTFPLAMKIPTSSTHPEKKVSETLDKLKHVRKHTKDSEYFHLPFDVMKEIKIIFDELAKPDLMKNCLHSNHMKCPHNPNEFVNGLDFQKQSL